MTEEAKADAPSELSITMSLKAAARRLGLGESTARRYARAGRFPGAFRVGAGAAWLVHRDEFEEQVRRLAQGKPAQADATDPDRLLHRALDEVRFRSGRRR